MTLRAADLRFVLPGVVRTARIVRPRPGQASARLVAVEAGLRAAGIDVRDDASPDDEVDLVLAEGAHSAAAGRVAARAALLLGRTSAPAHPGLQTCSVLVRSDVVRPFVIVPAGDRAALRYYLTSLANPGPRRSRARNTVLAHALRAPLAERLLPARSRLTLATRPRDGRLPRLVRSAVELGIPDDVHWVLMLGGGDDLQRAVFHLAAHGGRWVLKFSRVAGYDAPFRRDEAGLALVRAAGPTISAHAPDLVSRFEVDGLAASLETAVVGSPLVAQLHRGRRPPELAATVDAIAAWVVQLGVRTALPPQALDGERKRLERDVVPHWQGAGAPPDLVERVAAVPGVLQHGDLGSWNIITQGAWFGAVDWESARACGLPLWDLVYLLGDGLARIDGPASPQTLTERALRLFRGESPHSGRLFAHVAAAAQALQVPRTSVGPITTLCWLHHGRSVVARTTALGAAAPAPLGHLALLAGPWLADPALGPTWPAFMAWTSGRDRAGRR